MGNISQNNINSTIVNDSRFFNENDVRDAIVRSNFNGQSIKINDVALLNLALKIQQFYRVFQVKMEFRSM